MNARPKSLFGRQAALVCGHHLAAQAAQDCLGGGGTLVDAAITASAVLAVVLPHASSLGGCGMLLVHDPGSGDDPDGGRVHGLNGTGRAPLRAALPAFAAGMPQLGARAAVVPTLVRLWARAHERFGRRPWATLLEPAIALADGGIATPEELARNLAKASPAVVGQAGFRTFFHPDGKPLAAGDTLRQPALARVLRAIAGHGEDGFYRGEAAASLVRFSAAAGGLFGQDDFEQARADWVAPWSCPLGDDVAHVMPPNSVGVLMLRQLRAWEAAGRPAGEAATAAAIEEAIAAIAEGRDLIGDPERTPVDPARFGLDAHGLPPATEAAGRVDRLRASRLQAGDTTGFVAMDADGHAVAMLQSVFQPFGSGAVDPQTGILLNNRMFDFTTEPGRVNTVGPAIRPSHTLNPWLITQAGRPRIAGVSPGGVSQTTTGFQLASAALGETMTLGAVVAQPRWSLSRDSAVLLETGMAAGVAGRLREHGLSVVEHSDHAFYFGSAKLVRRTRSGWLEAAADARRQAAAIAW